MGVKDLWSILSPICEKKSLWELKSQSVAIDLSVWICENQTVDYRNDNLYLRNLFFRTSYMLLLDMKPIFVLEGTAPELKRGEMERRLKLNAKNKVDGEETKRNGNRSRLKSLQRQCEELLTCMGVSCMYSNGEAEALCAALNSKGIVDGVVTKDSDCFLYGARTVYRNFNISCNGGTFEKYDMEVIEAKLNLGRNKLIALSLLCGCDYNERGVEGVGKESALKFFSTVSDSEVLDRLAKWKAKPDDEENLPKVEKSIKQKALLNQQFPFYEIQNEFLNSDHDELQRNHSWKCPKIQEFVKLVAQKLAWKTDYAIEKFLPLLSRWHLLHDRSNSILQLDCIIKKRILRGVPSYEVKWTDFDRTTVEPMSYLKLKYDKELCEFETMKTAKKATARKLKGKETLPILPKLDCHAGDTRGSNIESPTNPQYSDVRVASNCSFTALGEESITVSDFECSATDLLELSSIVESIVSSRQ